MGATREEKEDVSAIPIVHRCVTRKAPQCLGESLKTNSEVGNRRTRGLNNLFLPSINSEFFRSSFQFKGSQDWNSLAAKWLEGSKIKKYFQNTAERSYKTTILYEYFIDLYVLVSMLCSACVGINFYFVDIFVNICVDFCEHLC